MIGINPAKIQYIAIAFCILLLILLFKMIIKRKLREEYIVVWLMAFVALLLIAIFRKQMDVFANWLGVFYSPSLLFLVLLAAIIVYSLHLSIVSSKMHWQIKDISSRMALLQHELNELKKLEQEREK